MNFDTDENLDYKLNEIASRVIKRIRMEKKYSLDEVVVKLNNIITKQSLFRYENNEARMKKNTFKKICLALGEDPDDVLSKINDIFIKEMSIDNATLENLSDTFKVPVLGKIPAGMPFEAIEDKYTIDYEEIPKNWLRGDNEFFALRIDGDSMEPEFKDKETVIFQKSSTCESGQYCCVMVNGNDATFKKVQIQENGILLSPLNSNNSSGYVATFYTKEEIDNLPIRIIGVVKRKIKDY